MSQIPINITKIKVNNSKKYNPYRGDDEVGYLFSIEEKGQQWVKTYFCDRNELLKFRDEINQILENTSTAEMLHLSNEKGKIVDEHYNSDKLCQNCQYKLSNKCIDCLFVCQSPLERQLYVELYKSYISFQTQYALNHYGKNISLEGKSYENAENNFKEVLTVVDFFIVKGQTKLCVYTDGHTYHERTEEQAQKDRNIDRKLQELGYQVLRYTGKEVKENCEKIIADIKKWIL